MMSFSKTNFLMLAGLLMLALVISACSDRRYARNPVVVRGPAPVVVVQQQPVLQQAPAPVVVQPSAPAASQPQPQPQGQVVTAPALPQAEVVRKRQSEQTLVDAKPLGKASKDLPRAGVTVPDLPPNVPQRLEQYRLGPGDKLLMKVFGQDDISGEFEISASGELSLPLIGQISAENLTIGELTEVISVELDKDFIVDPKVSIEVTNYRNFFILGQVGKPGGYGYQPGLNVRQAVALGGGFTRRASEEPVTIFRFNAAGELVKFQVGQAAVVLPGDTVEVHRRLF